MKIKLLIIGMLAFIALDAKTDTNRALSKEQIAKISEAMLAREGIIIPSYAEINLVSAYDTINSKRIETNPNDVFMVKKLKEYLAMNKEQQKNGYVKNTEPRAKELMELKHIAAYHQKKYSTSFSPESTHLRLEKNELKLAYTFVGVPASDMNTNIGIAPYGAYKQVENGDKANGWDGAVQFFEKNGIGNCAYTEHNRYLTGLGVELVKELVTYDVNSKPTVILVQGTPQSGFVYRLNWYDSTFSRELECANAKYSSQLRSEVIALANRIDSYQ